jgi:hypothetical protein
LKQLHYLFVSSFQSRFVDILRIVNPSLKHLFIGTHQIATAKPRNNQKISLLMSSGKCETKITNALMYDKKYNNTMSKDTPLYVLQLNV